MKEGKEGKERPALPVAGYEPPGWAGKAAPGLHLDVLKVTALTDNIKRNYLLATILLEHFDLSGGETHPETDD